MNLGSSSSSENAQRYEPAAQEEPEGRRSSLSSLESGSKSVRLSEELEMDEAALLYDENRDQTANLGANEYLENLADQSDKSNLKSAFMNMSNSIIGAGIVGQPYAVKQAGLVGGILLLLILTSTVDWTIRLIIINAKMSGTDTFQATVARCFGKPGLIVISIAQAIFALGGSMAFCVIIGDTIPHVVNAVFPNLHTIPVLGILSKRNTIIILVTVFISYPLSLNRNISKLAKASALAMVSMAIIVFTVVIRGPAINDGQGEFSLPLLTINSGILQGISVISFAFVCHHNSLMIFESLKTPTLDRFAWVTHWSTGVSMGFCMIMGVGGFLIFKDQTKGNVLNTFPGDDVMANIARFCFGLNMVTTLPLEIFVCREVILTYYWPDPAQHTTRKHIVSTSLLVGSCMAVSLFTCNLGAILELVGASTASLMAYVLPPMCYLKLSQKDLKHKIPSYACIVFGLTVMVLSTIQSCYKLFQGTEEEHCVV
jgi:sodium-coupled neutral amino acid transporter 11